MATTIKLHQYAEITWSDGRREFFPSEGHSTSYTSASDQYYQDAPGILAAGAAVTLDTSNDIANFDLVALISTQNIEIQITVDQGADISREDFVIKQRANIPFILTYDDGIAGHTTDWGAGTADKIEKITVKNVSASTCLLRTIVIGRT